MHLIQLILFIIIALIGFYVYRKFRNSVVDVIVFFLFLAAGMLFIAVPDLTTKIARFLGVGRGADLIFYLAILFFGFVSLKLYERIRKLERLMTEMIRQRAIAEAKDNRNS